VSSPTVHSDTPVFPVVTVLICTYNRAHLLGETLDSLAAMQVKRGRTWEVLVVDNRSTDNTAEVVRTRQSAYPVPLRYLIEEKQGKSYALNTGLASTNSMFVLFTDDDVRVDSRWLEASIEPMIADAGIGYTGGPVEPIWEGPPPRWLERNRAALTGAIAIVNYGTQPFVFEDEGRIPIGANMAIRRSILNVVGGFDPGLGRRGKSLLGQEQAEFFCRTRDHGIRGMYAPDMIVHHHVPRRRLSRRYFRRWWLWKGISRARLHRVHPVADDGVNMRHVKRIGGVPLFAFGELYRRALRWAGAILRGDVDSAAPHEMMMAYYAGYAWEDWRRHKDSAQHRVPTSERAAAVTTVSEEAARRS
jgi:glucosyl-dolichyl phosphate glucuronosyltransferase